MPKKHHKTHRHHRDKSSLKARSHRKPRRDHHHVNQNALEPIEEVSKERMKIDKNACGDYVVDSALARPQIEDDKIKKLRHSRDKNISKSDKVDSEKKKKEAINNEYLKKLEKATVRHRSLEKNEDSLLDKTKFLFRKEKSFNDAVRKIGDFKPDTDRNALKDDRHRKHRSRKPKENPKTDNRTELSPQKPPRSKNIEQTREKSQKKHKSKDKHSTDKKPTYGGVQEVIYCQLDHAPYKMRNDKNASEIKDLFHRVKKEDKRERDFRNRSHSHGKNTIENYVRSQEKLFEQHLKSEHKKNRERSKPSENSKHGEHRTKEKVASDMCHVDVNYVERKDSKMPTKTKHRPKNISEISLGPYEKYFAFEKNCRSEQCKRHHKQEATSKSVDRKHEKHKRRKHSPDKHEFAKERSRMEEEKIHQIVEGDLKTYFCKIQTMIDKKLDAILQVNKQKYEERKKEKELRESKRNKSKSPEKNTDHKREKEKLKHSRQDKENLNTEKLINEILRRMREEEQRNTMKFEESTKKLSPHKEHEHEADKRSISEHLIANYSSKLNPDHRYKPSRDVEEGRRPPIPHSDLIFPVKVMCSPAGRNSSELRTRRQSTMKEGPVILPAASSTSSGSKMFKRKTKSSPRHVRRQIYSASDERLCDKPHEDYRRSSSPGRVVMEVQQKPKSPPEYPSKHDISTFFCDTQKTPRNHEFIVQGIEPPILECTRNTPRKNPQIRKLECKTVSVVTIAPQPELRELPVANQTQTSSKSRKSSTIDRELVEKRKQTKRFKLYYQYSADSNSTSPEVNMASSATKSVVSDSYKVLSDPSEEPLVIRGHRQRNRRTLNSEVYQVMPTVPKKWNRISTPKDSHLNNIMEESSDLSISKQIQDYFVPLRGTRQYYCRVLSSSHSDYCFKIDKKPAISDLSLQSKDTWDGRYIQGDTSRNDRFDGRSRSEFKINPKTGHWGRYIHRSKSDVFLLVDRENKYVKSLFNEDIIPFVRDKNRKEDPNRNSAFKTLLKEKDLCAISACKSCQTVEVKNEAVETSMENSKQNLIESKHKQFQDIYKTIDILQEGIRSSKVAPKTADAAVSSTFFGSDEISDKKPQFDAIYKTIDNLEDRVIQTTRNGPVETADAAIGSPARSRHFAKKIHDVAAGDSGPELCREAKSPRSKSENPPAKVYRHQRKSTAASPMRITEEAVTQVSAETSTKRAFTPRPPRPKLFARQPKQKEVTPKALMDTKKAPPTPRAPIVPKREPPQRSAAARPPPQSKERPSKPVEVSPKPLQCVKVFRSEEGSPSVKMQRSEIAYDETNPVSAGSNRARSYVGSRATRKESKPVINGDTVRYCVYPAAVQKKFSSKNRVCDSCFHHYPPDTPKTPGMAASKKPLVVNTAAFRRQPPVQTKIIEIDNNSSTSSSVGDNLPQNARRSRSLVELGHLHKSKLTNSRSDVCCLHQTLFVEKTDELFTEAGSSVSNNMEKFANKPNLRCPQSHGTSLDHYIGNKFTSRLLLTKDYKGADLSAYQKRKLYDQSIRQRMKKKFKFSKMDVGPQIFEVRFLSMVNPEQRETLERSLRSSKFARVINEDVVNPGADDVKSAVDEKRAIAEPCDALRVKERNLIFNASNEAVEAEKAVAEEAKDPLGQLHQEKLLSFCKKFFNMNTDVLDREILKDTTCSCSKFSKNCSACRNFLNVVDTLYSSLTQYREAKCSSSHQAVVEIRDPPEMVDKVINTISPQVKSHEKDSVKVEKIYSASFNKNSSESNQSASPSRVNFLNPADFSSFKVAKQPEDYPGLSQPMSCPILATNSSSFEFLYEATSSSGHGVASRETVIANLTRPFDQNFNFNTSQYNVETPFIRAGNYESPARSVESGYASVNSKSRGANSLTNFFKKPHIAALFKPPVLTRRRSDLCRATSEIGPSHYKEMARNCQLYARKVRQRSELKFEKDAEDYQEFSLKFLLGDFNTVVLESKVMNAPSEESVLDDINGSAGEAERDEECRELTNKASNHEVASKPSQSSYHQNGCKLILSNECLKVDSITYLGPEFFKDDAECTESIQEFTDDCDGQSCSLDSNNKDLDTHNFFTSLIRTYEKELEICNKLYNDDGFNSALLSAIEGQKNKKKVKFFRFFAKKPLANQQVAKIEDEAEMAIGEKASIKLQTLASNAKKCFSMLAEAVKMNENINNEIKICGLLRLLERIESGDFSMMQNDERVSLEENIRSQVTSAFINVYELCQREAKKYKKRITKPQLELIKSFVIKHRISLLSKTDIVASYIARGIIQTEDQLKAAITFLIRSQSHAVDATEFEKFCTFIK